VTSKASPEAGLVTPSMVAVSSIGSALDNSSRVASRLARSAEPGAYVLTASLTGAGTVITASTKPRYSRAERSSPARGASASERSNRASLLLGQGAANLAVAGVLRVPVVRLNRHIDDGEAIQSEPGPLAAQSRSGATWPWRSRPPRAASLRPQPRLATLPPSRRPPPPSAPPAPRQAAPLRPCSAPRLPALRDRNR
jgi:hypothetical protein